MQKKTWHMHKIKKSITMPFMTDSSTHGHRFIM